jgi:hypothetical protein
MIANEKFDRMMMMREQGRSTGQNVLMIKEKYTHSKRKGDSKHLLEQIIA